MSTLNQFFNSGSTTTLTNTGGDRPGDFRILSDLQDTSGYIKAGSITSKATSAALLSVYQSLGVDSDAETYTISDSPGILPNTSPFNIHGSGVDYMHDPVWTGTHYVHSYKKSTGDYRLAYY